MYRTRTGPGRRAHHTAPHQPLKTAPKTKNLGKISGKSEGAPSSVIPTCFFLREKRCGGSVATNPSSLYMSRLFSAWVGLLSYEAEERREDAAWHTLRCAWKKHITKDTIYFNSEKIRTTKARPPRTSLAPSSHLCPRAVTLNYRSIKTRD